MSAVSMEGKLLLSMLGLIQPMIAAYLPMSDGTPYRTEIAFIFIKAMSCIEYIETYFSNG